MTWARAWKMAAKRKRSELRELEAAFDDLLTDYRTEIARNRTLAHAETMAAWLKEFARRVHFKKWRTQRAWDAWWMLKRRRLRLEHLRRLQAPEVIIGNEERMVQEAREGLAAVLLVQSIKGAIARLD